MDRKIKEQVSPPHGGAEFNGLKLEWRRCFFLYMHYLLFISVLCDC